MQFVFNTMQVIQNLSDLLENIVIFAALQHALLHPQVRVAFGCEMTRENALKSVPDGNKCS